MQLVSVVNVSKKNIIAIIKLMSESGRSIVNLCLFLFQNRLPYVSRLTGTFNSAIPFFVTASLFLRHLCYSMHGRIQSEILGGGSDFWLAKYMNSCNTSFIKELY